MRITRVAFVVLVGAGVSFVQAQTPAPAQSKAKAKAAPARQLPADLAQLMKGILFPNSNVIFFAQDGNPNDVKPAKDPATATDPLASAYGKWDAVENSGLALAEAASLLTVPGRKCSNGRAVPTANADWPKFVQALRDAGLAAYKAAQSKSNEKMLDAADVMTTACSNCHEKYREKAALADRCK